MTFYIKSGDTYRITSETNFNIKNILKAGFYSIELDRAGFFLQSIEPFKKEIKVYGNLPNYSERIISTFFDRKGKSTGVILSGEKGSGKTLLAKEIALKLFEQNIPVLICNQAFAGNSFNHFIQSIEQPCIVIFDEFEKVYSEESQQELLTLFDGLFPSEKLFILTSNEYSKISSLMFNRPGRIFYRLDFKGLDEKFIIEYCEDNLKNKKYIDYIINITGMFYAFNFDMLKALVEEMNRYDESPIDAMKMLNIRTDSVQKTKRYEVKLFIDNKKFEIENDKQHLNPFVDIEVVTKETTKENDKFLLDQFSSMKYEDDGYTEYTFRFTPNDIRKMNIRNGIFQYVNDKNCFLLIEEIKKEDFDISKFF